MVEGKRWLEDPLSIQQGEVGSVAFSPDDKTLAVASGTDENGGVVLWDLDLKSGRKGRPDRQPELYPGRMASVFSRERKPPELHRPARSEAMEAAASTMTWRVGVRLLSNLGDIIEDGF